MRGLGSQLRSGSRSDRANQKRKPNSSKRLADSLRGCVAACFATVSNSQSLRGVFRVTSSTTPRGAAASAGSINPVRDDVARRKRLAVRGVPGGAHVQARGPEVRACGVLLVRAPSDGPLRRERLPDVSPALRAPPRRVRPAAPLPGARVPRGVRAAPARNARGGGDQGVLLPQPRAGPRPRRVAVDRQKRPRRRRRRRKERVSARVLRRARARSGGARRGRSRARARVSVRV